MTVSEKRARPLPKRRPTSLVGRVIGAIAGFFGGLGFLMGEVWGFMRVRKRYWMAPIFVVLLLFGLLIALVQNAAVAQFIYTLF